MKVVSNSGPLIALARIDRLDLLPGLFDHIVIPSSVLQEVTADPQRCGADTLGSAPWLRVAPVEDQTAVAVLRFSLDRGESEAIVLARQLGALLLIDERRGRTIATSLAVPRTGTIGILLAAKRAGLIEGVTPLLHGLIEAGVRISQTLYLEARTLAGEG